MAFMTKKDLLKALEKVDDNARIGIGCDVGCGLSVYFNVYWRVAEQENIFVLRCDDVKLDVECLFAEHGVEL